MTSLRFASIALALPLLLVVSGCTASSTQGEASSPSPSATIADEPTPTVTPSASSTPTPTPTATATSTPTPEASLAVSIEIGGSSIRVLGKNKTTLADIDYTASPAKAIAAIDKALGETATVSTTPEYNCEASHKLASWGKGFTMSYGRAGLPGKAKISFSATSKSTPGGVKIVTPDGWGVGGLLGAILKADPGTQHERSTAHVTAVYYDIAHGTAADKTFFGTFYGAYADSYDGRIKDLLSPTYYYEDC